MGFHRGGANSTARPRKVRSEFPGFFSWRGTIGQFACLLLATGAIAATHALNAAPEGKIQRQAPTESRRIPVRMVAESWAATTAAPPVAHGHRMAQFIGHYPGYAAAKQAANERLKKLLLRSPAGPAATAPAPLAAASALVTFDGPNESETQYIPPDSQLAAGPTDIVVAINDLLAIYDKTGALQGAIQQFPTFFSSLGVNGQIFDPRLIYDQTDGRFILSAADVDTKNFAFGDVLLAVSATSDPTGVWYKYAINFMGRDASNTYNTFPDFPGLGLSATAVYLTSNQFELNSQCIGGAPNSECSFSDAWIKVVGLPALLSGGSTLSITTFQNVHTAGGNLAFSIQPALTYGSPADEFLVAASFSANPGTRLNLFSIPTAGTPSLSSADLPVSSFALPPDAPQPGSTSLILTDDFRILNAVWSNGSLWCGQNVAGTIGQATARWYQIALGDLTSAALTQSGDVTGAGAAYYPALAAESNGTAVMAFSTSSAIVPVSAAYAERLPSDPSGTMASSGVYGLGLGPYDETIGDRWGDYSGVSLDPSASTFWGIAEYAGTPDPHFVTRVAQFAGKSSLQSSPAVLSFGGVPVGQLSSAQSVKFTNIGTTAITLGTATFSGGNASDFSLSNDQCSGTSLPAGNSCTLDVSFTPSLQSAETAVLSLDDGQGDTVAVALEGDGVYEVILTLSASSVDFGTVPEQQASATQVVTLTNTGNSTAQLSNLRTIGDFGETSDCGTSLAGGSSCQFTLTFYPTAAATFSGALAFNANTQTYDYMVQLTGTGVAIPAALFCPSSLAFGNQTQGVASPARTVILTNSGGETLTVTGISTTGDFAETTNCPGSLAPRSSCSINVTFTPTTLGGENGTLSVSDDAAGSPQSVNLSGTGVSSTAAATAARSVAVVSALHSRTQISLRTAALLVHALRPLSFAPNVGQFRPGLRYVAHVPGYALAVTRAGLLLEMPVRVKPSARAPAGKRKSATLARLQMRLADANPYPTASGVGELPGKANYFFGRNPRAWRTNVPTYARVRLRNVYPGIDLVYYGNRRRLEYDFLVHPGADPGRIRLAFAGASELRLDAGGDLLLNTHAGIVRLHKPVVYQPVSAGPAGSTYIDRRGRWVLQGTDVAAFRVGRYDRRKALVIDPVLVFSTYLGGSGSGRPNTIAADSQGNAYVAGLTSSTDFPVTSGAFQQTCGPTNNLCGKTAFPAGYVAKLSSDGSTLLYATYLGGSADTQINAIAVDSTGNAYVTGFTASPDFPVTTGAFQPQCTPAPGSSECGTPFVTKLNPTGSSLVYSTYLGGTSLPSPDPNTNEGSAIAVDASGDTYVAGVTVSQDFPTTAGSFQPNDPAPGWWHGFLTELDPSGSALVFSTYLGGSHSDWMSGVALDSSGNAYVTGSTESPDFPTTPGAFQRGLYGASSATAAPQNAFVANFSPSGSLLYSTLLGGTSASGGASVAVDSTGAAYIAGGIFQGGNFPTTAAAFETVPANFSAFVTKLHPDGCALLYSTFLGPQQPGITTSGAAAIAIDGSGDAYVAGTFSTASGTTSYPSSYYFPVLNPLQPTIGSNSGFVSELNPTGSGLLFSTPFGEGEIDALTLDANGNMYIAGDSDAPDEPIVNAIQPNCISCQYSLLAASDNSFLAKISPAAATGISLTRPSLSLGTQPEGVSSLTQHVGLMNNQSVALNIQGVTVSGAGFSLPASSIPCTGSIPPGTGCIVAVQFAPAAVGAATGTVTITDDAPGGPQQIALSGAGTPDFLLTADPQQTAPPVVGTTSVTYNVGVGPVAGVAQFSGSVSLSCSGIAPATCAFSPTSIQSGTPSTLTVGNLSAVTGNSVSFDVVGTYSDQTVSLPVQFSFADFSVSASPSSATVTAGNSVSYTIGVTPIRGFTGEVDLACSGLPAYATCAFAPSPLVVSATNTSNDTLTISTVARSSAPPFASPDSWPLAPLLPLSWWAMLLTILLFLSLCFRRLRRHRIFLPILLLLLLAGSVSCGGGGGSTSSSGGGSSGGNAAGTPSGSYTITVTGKSGPDSHIVKLSLTVQ